MKILVKATANVFGLRRGDIAEVEVGPTVDALVEQGYFIWLDAPIAEPVFEVTPVVKKRKPRTKKVGHDDLDVEYAAYAADLAAPAHVDYTTWADDGGTVYGSTEEFLEALGES